MGKHRYIPLVIMFILVVLFTYPGIAYAQESSSLSIQDALDMAYQNNPDLLKATLKVDKAKIQRDDAARAVTWIPTGGLISPVYQQVFNSYQQAEINWDAAKKARDAEKDRLTQEVIAAYAQAIKDYNTMETTRLNLENMKEQRKVNSLAKEVGYSSEHDYNKFKSGLKGLDKGFEAAKAKYESSVASLVVLLGKTQGWDPELTSRVVLNRYKRNEMSVEINRALSESVLVMQEKALLDIAENQQHWILPGVSSDTRKIDLGLAEIDYDQAKRSAWATMEGLYHGIDALEGQIEAAQIAYQTAQEDLEIAQLKYELGMIPRYSMIPDSESLSMAELGAAKKVMELESLQADLAKNKAMFAYLTGKEVYAPGDWSGGGIIAANENN